MKRSIEITFTNYGKLHEKVKNNREIEKIKLEIIQTYLNCSHLQNIRTILHNKSQFNIPSIPFYLALFPF